MMKIRRVARQVAICGAALASSAVLAQTVMDLGKREYVDNCVACHGADGKGGGSYIEVLKRTPPDLTTLTKRNGGILPMARVYESIEGASASHGTRDMPIWGQTYNIKAAEYYMDVNYNAEAYVRTRLLALVEYLNRIQAK